MSAARCPTCRAFVYSWERAHRCPPAWEVWPTDDVDRDEVRTVYALDEEDAAKEYAERHDGDGLSDGDDLEVYVRPIGRGDDYRKRFNVRAELVVAYHVDELYADDDADDDGEASR